MSSTTVKDLVPGDPEEIWRLADSYNRMAHLCEEVGHRFRAVDVGTWYGQAAESFHARFEQQPKRFLSMADCYLEAAVALDTYAAVLAWAQRQAGEVIALDDKHDSPAPAKPTLTITQQAELAGVIIGTDQPEPESNRADQRALALDTYHRALDMLDTVGDESATTIKAAAEWIPAPTVIPRPPVPADLVVHAVLPAPATRTWFDPATLRDDLQDWSVAIKEIRRRLRWDGLNRLSPRLARHIFEGHYRPSDKVYTGYHHREGGVDQGALRVVQILEGPDQHGVYAALVRDPQSPPTANKKSTFFPDSWSRAEVLGAVRHVFLEATRTSDTDYDPAKRRFRGVYRGVRIEGYVERGVTQPRLCDIVTAYPRGARRR